MERIARAFRGIDRGLIVLVDHATNARLGELVRGLVVEHPELDVLTEAPRVEDVPRGALLVLAARAVDALWLNYTRPIFRERGLKVVLWSTAEVTAALAKEAPDFFDWTSRRFECPGGVPRQAILGLRAALCARAPGVRWRGPELEASFEAAFPGRPLVRVRADLPYDALIEAARSAGRGWNVWSEIYSERDLYRVRWAMAEAGRRGRVVLDAPRVVHDDLRSPVKDYWLVHGQLMNLHYAREVLGDAGAQAPGRLAALLDLEPEAIRLAVGLLKAGMSSASVEEAARESGDPGAAVARLAWGQASSLVLKERFEAMPPVRRAFAADREARKRHASERAAMLARLRERVSATLDVTKADVEPLLRDGSVPGQAWDAMIAAARSVQAHDVAAYWSARGSGSTESVARRTFFECIRAAQHALADRDVDAALRAVEEIREDDTRIEGNDEFYDKVVFRVARAALAAGRAGEGERLFEHLMSWRKRGEMTFRQLQRLLQFAKLDAAMVERCLQESVRTHAPEEAPWKQVVVLRVLAESLAAQGRFAEAEDQLRRALALEAHVHPLLVVRMLTRLADVLAAQGRHAEAVPLASKALGIARRYRSNMAFRNGALALCRLAESRSALGEPDARETAQQALDALRAEFEELDAVRREVEPRLLRILGLDT
ncbi:tetratricopeptide repeat protein [Sorangium sp. So ce375]|uniref:tetratricopeptide repeat protein n=1 Tax=Sorangium sp. So ce375 TaxID=3133306 RepID=UPI003F5B7C9F